MAGRSKKIISWEMVEVAEAEVEMVEMEVEIEVVIVMVELVEGHEQKHGWSQLLGQKYSFIVGGPNGHCDR